MNIYIYIYIYIDRQGDDPFTPSVKLMFYTKFQSLNSNNLKAKIDLLKKFKNSNQ